MEGFRCIARSALDIDVYVMVAKLTSLLHYRLVNVVILLLLLLIIFVNSRVSFREGESHSPPHSKDLTSSGQLEWWYLQEKNVVLAN